MSALGYSDSMQTSEFSSMVNRGFDFTVGGESVARAGAAAAAEVGQSLQDAGVGAIGTSAAVGLGRAGLRVAAKLTNAVKGTTTAAEDAGTSAGSDLSAAATPFDPLADAATNAASGVGDATVGATDVAVTTTTTATTDATAAGFLAGGADAEEVLAGSGVGETPVGLIAMAGIGLVMGIAGFFLHRHAEKHATKVAPTMQEQTGSTNYFIQSGV